MNSTSQRRCLFAMNPQTQRRFGFHNPTPFTPGQHGVDHDALPRVLQAMPLAVVARKLARAQNLQQQRQETAAEDAHLKCQVGGGRHR